MEENKTHEKQKEHNDLKKIKEKYKSFQEKYSLPDFKFLNENFEIENVLSEETEIFIKRIRKQMTEKISVGLRALEMFTNPQNSPIFIFNIIKSFSASDKELINELYKKFSEFEIDAFGLENSYDEKKEVEFIKRISGEWTEISGDFDKIYRAMKSGHKQDSKKNEKSYFG
jgi:hypothetical protein